MDNITNKKYRGNTSISMSGQINSLVQQFD